MLLTLINSILSGSSPSSMFTMLNAIQLILLLPLIGAYLPVNVLSYIKGLNFALLEFGADFITFVYDFKNFKFEQNNQYLNLIGLNYG